VTTPTSAAAPAIHQSTLNTIHTARARGDGGIDGLHRLRGDEHAAYVDCRRSDFTTEKTRSSGFNIVHVCDCDGLP
jgi:hypothetical protein